MYDEDRLLCQALSEGKLTIAGGGPAEAYRPWAAGFEKQYPGITVQVQGDFSKALVAEIDRQQGTGHPDIDVPPWLADQSWRRRTRLLALGRPRDFARTGRRRLVQACVQPLTQRTLKA